MNDQQPNDARSPFILCPSCKNKLGQRQRDGSIVQLHARRRTVSERIREITCEQCGMTMVFPAA